MNKNIKKEILTTLAILSFSLLCIFSPTTSPLYTWFHLLFIALFIIFALNLWNSKTHDEREQINKTRSSDAAFVAGGLLSGIAIMYQIYTQGQVDIWIMIILSTMLIVRILSQIWFNKHN